MHRNGITCPNEMVLKQAASLLHCLCFQGHAVDQEALNRSARKIKELVKAMDKGQPYTLQHIVVHPLDPRDPPIDVYRFAYGDSMPVEKSTP